MNTAPQTRRELREAAARATVGSGSEAPQAPEMDAPHASLGAEAPQVSAVPDPQVSVEPDPRLSVGAEAPRVSAVPGPQADAPATRRRERGVWYLLGTGLLTGVLLLFVAIGVLAIAVPAATGSTALTVLTSSMEPSLPPGTMVVVRPTDVADIAPGDILTYQLRSGEPMLITHRVTQQTFASDGTLRFITRGDNNPSVDPDPVRAEQVRGTVWYVIPYVGWVSNWITGEARALVIPIAVGLLVLYATWMYISAYRDRRRRLRGAPASEGPALRRTQG